MANVSYWAGTWVGDMAPGEVHSWIMWGFNYPDNISVSAHPVVGDPNADRILKVENVRVEGNVSGRRLFFDVRNVGPNWVPGYANAYSWVSP